MVGFPLLGLVPPFYSRNLEHIHWDQATVLRQAGILSTHVSVEGSEPLRLRLPVAGVESTEMLLNPYLHNSNEMLKPEWTSTQPI